MGLITAGTPVVSIAPGLVPIMIANEVVLGGMKKAAESILEAARETAPVASGTENAVPGALRDSGRIEVDGKMIYRVIFGGTGDVDYAAYVEFGTSDTPTFAFLRRGVEAAGYSL
jgi:HK97 gp10 family phage protein